MCFDRTKYNTHTHTKKNTPTNNNKADYKHTNYSESKTSSYLSQDMGVKYTSTCAYRQNLLMTAPMLLQVTDAVF